eukprot:gene6338-7064_t
MKTVFASGLVLASLAFVISFMGQSVDATTTDADCQKKNSSCYTCTELYSCYWCKPSKQCRKYPVGSIVPRDCTKHQWFYKQCTVAGYWLIIVVPCVGIFLLICLGCCIYCCCCRTSKAKKEEKYKLETARLNKDKERRKAAQSQKKSDRAKKADEVRKKYGLYQHESSYQKLQDMD